MNATGGIEAYGLIRIVARLGIGMGPDVAACIAARPCLISFLAAVSSSALYFFITWWVRSRQKPPTIAFELAATLARG